jgi:adenosylcobinamide-phosphate synthase
VAGIPGLLGYRAVNTLDAMIGYRNARYTRFGWAAARVDDAANWVPARVTVALVAVAAPVQMTARPPSGPNPSRKWPCCQPGAAALRAARRDGHLHPSPNAGPVEAAWAGALGVALGGRTVYRHGVEERPRLGDGPAPDAADLRRAARLSRVVAALAALLASVVAH